MKHHQVIGCQQKHHIIISWADYITLLAPCLCMCVCVSVGCGKTPVQSLFNFPDIKLHGRAISRAVDYRKVISEIINRLRTVWACAILVCINECICELYIHATIKPVRLQQWGDDMLNRSGQKTNVTDEKSERLRNPSCKSMLTAFCRALTVLYPIN